MPNNNDNNNKRPPHESSLNGVRVNARRSNRPTNPSDRSPDIAFTYQMQPTVSALEISIE